MTAWLQNQFDKLKQRLIFAAANGFRFTAE